jgi:peptidoglycan/LPS O-acetylase OafA/YrhL
MIALAVVVCGCTAILLSVLGLERTIPGPILFFGKLSLGLYVFHIFAQALAVQILTRLGFAGWPAILAKDVVGLTLTVAFALVSYYGLERPFLKYKDRLSILPARTL